MMNLLAKLNLTGRLLGFGLLLPATAMAAVTFDQSVSLWNLGGALVLIGAGWMALKGRIKQLEDKQNEAGKRFEEIYSISHQNQSKIMGFKSEIYERLIDQERVLFEKVDDRIARLEDKIDRLIEKGNGR